jgi:Tfp pilus assembly protein PilV
MRTVLLARSKRFKVNQAGFLVIEVILASALFGLIMTALVGAYLYGQEATTLAGSRARSVMIADEGLAATRNIRDAAFTNLTAGTFGLTTTGNQWNLTGASDMTDVFTRAVTLTSLDTRRKSLSETVTWQQNLQRNGSTTVESRLTNWTRNFANWASPTVQTSTDLTGNADANGVALYHAGGNTYAVVVRTASPDAELYVYNVTNPASISLTGSLELGSNANAVAISGNFAVVATDNNAAELQVVSLVAPSSPTLAGSLNLPGNANATSVVANGSSVFLGRAESADPEIYSISIGPTGTPALLASLDLGAGAAKLALAQNNQYLYVASDDNNNELRIIAVSNPLSLTIAGSYNATGNSDGTAVTAFSTYAVLGRADGNILVIQASNPAVPTLVSSALDIGAQVNDLTMGVGDIYAFAATSTGSTPTMILNLATPATPTLLGSTTMAGSTLGVAWDFDLNRAFTVGTDNSTELSVIRPN